MPGLETILLSMLMAAAAGPLLLVGVSALAFYFDLRIATWLLDATAWTLTVQWRLGGWINLVGGLALAALGVWLIAHDQSLLHRIVGLVFLVLGGAWRAWHGGLIVLGQREP